MCVILPLLVESSHYQASVAKPNYAGSTATLWPHPLVNGGGGVSWVIYSDDMIPSDGCQVLAIWTPAHGKELQNRRTKRWKNGVIWRGL